MIRLLVIYDISKDNNKLYKYLKSIGTHIQRSVFEIEAENRDLDKISQKITSIIDNKTDKVIIYNLGDTNKINKTFIGISNSLSLLDKGYIII